MNQAHIEFLSSPQWARMLEADLLPWVEAAGDLGNDVLEIGPGPGLTTDLLRARVSRLTAIEVDEQLATSLRKRLRGTNVEVLCGDATDSRLPSSRFSAATCFSVLHHMRSADDQDRLFSEVLRVLHPGALFVGADSRDLEMIRTGHADDIFTPIDPEALSSRLETAGFERTRLDVGDYQFRFVTWKPLRTTMT